MVMRMTTGLAEEPIELQPRWVHRGSTLRSSQALHGPRLDRQRIMPHLVRVTWRHEEETRDVTGPVTSHTTLSSVAIDRGKLSSQHSLRGSTVVQASSTPSTRLVKLDVVRKEPTLLGGEVGGACVFVPLAFDPDLLREVVDAHDPAGCGCVRGHDTCSHEIPVGKALENRSRALEARAARARSVWFAGKRASEDDRATIAVLLENNNLRGQRGRAVGWSCHSRRTTLR